MFDWLDDVFKVARRRSGAGATWRGCGGTGGHGDGTGRSFPSTLGLEFEHIQVELSG